MRIAYIVNHLGPSGVNQVVADLVSVFTARGHQCVVCYLKDCDAPMRYACDTLRLSAVEDLTGDFDVIHAHGLGPMLYVARHRRALSHRQNGRQRPLFVTTLHCYCFQDLPSLYGRLKGGLMAMVYLWSTLWQDRVVCLSKDMMSYYARWISRRKLRYVYNTRSLPFQEDITYDADDMKLVEKLKAWHAQGYHVIGMNGVLIYRKGVDLMLRALQRLNHSDDRYRLVLVGDGKDKDDFVKLSVNLHLDGMVLFAGHRQDAYRFLPLYDVLAMPSHSEGFPLSLLEAAAYGKRVVISDLPIVKECFDGEIRQELANGRETVAFKVDANVDETVSRLSEAVREAMKEKNMGDVLCRHFEKDFSPSAFAQRYESIYSSFGFRQNGLQAQ